MKRHRHLTALEWHASPDVVSYIDHDRPEVFAQQGYVLEIVVTIRHRDTVLSSNRNAPQHRHESVTDDARLHNIRVDVDGGEPLVHVHYGFRLWWVSSPTV